MTSDILFDIHASSDLRSYVLSFLPTLTNGKYHTPYHIACFLFGHTTKKIGNEKISKATLIQYLIDEGLVPCKRTTLYKILKKLQEKDLPQSITWSDLGTAGRKPFLSKSGLQELINEIKFSTDGGYAMSHVEIRDRVEKKIKIEWKKKNKLHLLPHIPISTLNAYASVVKSQAVFNVHANILNKTQSRVIAEWSFRSTISYLMAILATHYIPDVSSNCGCTRRKDLSNEALETLKLVEKQYNKMIGNSGTPVQLTPVLPNLITSTDEVTIFASSSVIHGKDSYYIVSKPSYIKNEHSNSGSRNHYKKKPSGDNSHCRGVRIVLNCTFTAGGLSSPLFVVVYGMSSEEMPNDETVTLEVPGLTVGGDIDIYSKGKGYITFVRGKEDNDDNDIPSEDQHDTQLDEVQSKEARIASLYRTLVYHPFIQHIRKVKYGFDTDSGEEIPEHLRAVGWMDGANGQLKEITKEERLKEEDELKISCTKHSAARTVVE